MKKSLNINAKHSFSELCEAVMADDISELGEVLHEKDQLGYTNFNVNGCLHQVPLNDAVVQRDYDKCKMLIDCNADVNKMLEYRTPLNLAEEIGNFPIARLLVKKRKQDKSLYRNPLHIAVKECDYHLCEFHLKSINVNSVDEKDRTALHVAVMHAPDELCELLIKNGADVFARDIFSDTPIQLAFYLGRHELREFALSYFSNEIC